MFFPASQGRVCSHFQVCWLGVAHDIFLFIWLRSCLRRGRMWPVDKCVSIVQVCIGLVNIHVWVSVYRGVCLRENLLGVNRTCLFEFQCIPIHIFRGTGGCAFWWFIPVWCPMVGACIRICRGVCRDRNVWYWFRLIFSNGVDITELKSCFDVVSPAVGVILFHG